MTHTTKIGRIMVPVADQDRAIEFYRDVLGCTVAVDAPFGDGDRWVEVTLPGGGAAVALTRPQGELQPGRMTGIALDSTDPRADHAELKANGVDVDAELLGGEGGMPLMFFMRDRDGNHLVIVQE